MFSKLAKLVSLTFVLSVAVAQDDDDKVSSLDIFDNDSDFMRGFETGLFLRSKGGSIEEFGCKYDEESASAASKAALDQIKNSINMAKATVALDPIVEDALLTVVDFIEGIFQFITILMPSGRGTFDQYCTGMIFGLQGSKLLVNVANTLMNKDERNVKDKILPDNFSDTFKKLGKGLFKTAAKNMEQFSDEL